MPDVAGSSYCLENHQTQRNRMVALPPDPSEQYNGLVSIANKEPYPSTYSVPGMEVGGYPDTEISADSQDGSSWALFSTQHPAWTGGEMDQVQTPTQLPHSIHQQQQQQPPPLPPQQQQHSQQADFLQLYSSLDHQSARQMHPPNPRRYTIQTVPAVENSLHSVASSSNQPFAAVNGSHTGIAPGPSTTSYPSWTALQTPHPIQNENQQRQQQQKQQHPAISAGSTQGCFCAMLGHPCTCIRHRPRSLTVEQSSSTSSSSSAGGLGDSTSDVPSHLPRVHLHHPYGQKNASTQLLSLYPNSLSTTSSRFRGSRIKPYNQIESAPPTSTYPHSTHAQEQSYLLGQTFQLSPVPFLSTSSSSSSGGATSQRHLPDGTLSYFSNSDGVGGTAAGPYDTALSTSPSQETDFSLSGIETDGAEVSMSQASTSLSNNTNSSRLDYRSADSSLPRWTSRSNTSANNAYSMTHSLSQLSLPSSQANYASYGMGDRSETSSSIVSGMVGFASGHTRSDTAPPTPSSMSQPVSISQHQGDGADGGGLLNNSDRFSTEDEKWTAIVNRIHAGDGYFVYGALVTRIYCRPSCASKRPDRNRVVFFSHPEAHIKAEQAGFRACKRCKPRTPGTADVCVLAVGQCLRHITQAALLGESEEVDARLKKRTLKEYSLDYGVSAFHFHRTLKNVSTLTPGDYSKACHALVLQDEIGMDKKNGQPLSTRELQQKLRGWSSRRARRAVGNILPNTYSNGFPGVKMYYIYAPNTSFGNVAILYSKGEESNLQEHVAHPLDTDAYSNFHCTVLSTLIGEDALSRSQMRAPAAVGVQSQADWLRSLVEDLARNGLREVQMPQEVIPWVRRARVWLAVKNALEPKTRAPGKRRNNSEGDDEDDDEEEEAVSVKEEME